MDTPSNLTEIIELFTKIGLELIPFMGAAAFLVFVYGIARFIKVAGNEKEIGESKKLLIWGVVGLFVLVTIWSIISFMQGELGVKNNNWGIPQIPEKIINK